MPNTIELKIEEALIAATRTLAENIFLTSQRTVPVKTGRLRASGSVKHESSVATSETPTTVSTIHYSVPYADIINRTNLATASQGTMEVKEHIRRYPSGKVATVRKHDKKIGSQRAGFGRGWLTLAIAQEVALFTEKAFPTSETTINLK